jgi:hypothetical protein
MSNPFVIAEQYIQLRKVWSPKSMGDYMMRINELIVTPLITIFFILTENVDFLGFASALFSTIKGWMEFFRYSSLRFEMQQMYLDCMKNGGPFISTNDADYLPYVYADAVLRADMRRQDSVKVHPLAEPWKRML